MLREFVRRSRNVAVFVAIVLATGAVANGATVQLVGQIQSREVTESSGVVASRQHDGVYYTHNDSGNAPVIYAMNADGDILREYRVPARHTDWEDIAIDEQNRLYIANIGNNDADKAQVEIFRFPEPDPNGDAAGNDTNRDKKKRKPKKDKGRAEQIRVQVEKSWVLTYPDKPFNAESLFIHAGHGYLIAKLPIGTPAALYRFPLEGPSDVKLEKVTDLPAVKAPVTSADISPDGKRLAVLSEAGLHLLDLTGDLTTAAAATPRLITLPHRNLEGVCFSKAGILLTAESRQIYLIPADTLEKK